MKHFFFFIIIGLIVPSVFAQTAKQKVAVYVTGDAESGYKKVIGSKLVTGITRSDSYAAVERTADFLTELAKEQDYQMSGAVSNNQIVRVGKQFGVRYVLVADISEVFESMFISARMIDVQTGQITNATEASNAVRTMEELTELSGQIVLGLLGNVNTASQGAKIKVIGPFKTYKALYEYSSQIPKGYVMANKADVEEIIASYKLIDKKIYYPICTTILTSESTSKTSSYEHTEYSIIGEIINEDSSITPFSYNFYKNFWYRNCETSFNYHLTNIDNFYIYVIKE